MHHDYHHLRVPTLTRSVRHESVRLYTPVRQNSFNARKYRALRSQRLARIYTLRTSMLVVAVRVRKALKHTCAPLALTPARGSAPRVSPLMSANAYVYQCATSAHACTRLRATGANACT